jgi:hypothetical protein
VSFKELVTKLTPWDRVVEKLIVPQLAKFPTIYGATGLIAIFTRAHHLFL